MAYATVADLQARWPAMPVSLNAQAGVLLDDAAVRIDAYAPLPPDPYGLSPAELAVRQMVSCEMVLYLLRAESTTTQAPGVTQSSRTMGPFSESWSYESGAKTLYLTADMKALLRPRRQQAFSVDLLGRDV